MVIFIFVSIFTVFSIVIVEISINIYKYQKRRRLEKQTGVKASKTIGKLDKYEIKEEEKKKREEIMKRVETKQKMLKGEEFNDITPSHCESNTSK
jgi:hypothetical protein